MTRGIPIFRAVGMFRVCAARAQAVKTAVALPPEIQRPGLGSNELPQRTRKMTATASKHSLTNHCQTLPVTAEHTPLFQGDSVAIVQSNYFVL